MICLDGLNSEDLRNILDYVYEGEVKVLQEDLDRCLNIAQRLKLEGLIETKEPEETYFKNTITADEKFDGPSQRKYTKMTPIHTNMNVSSRSLVVPATGDESMIKQTMHENTIENSDGTLSCRICGKVASGSQKTGILRQHMEIHIVYHTNASSVTRYSGKPFFISIFTHIYRSKIILGQSIHLKKKIKFYKV